MSLQEEGDWAQIHTREEGHVTSQAEIGVMHIQARGC